MPLFERKPRITILGEEAVFPDPDQALTDPDGLLAVGGDLSPERLLAAYAHGIFPWYSPGQAILWWSPSRRMVLFPDEFHLSRSMRRFLNKEPFTYTIDDAFDDVIDACAKIRRKGERGTWITREMRQAYKTMHELGHARSLEVWAGGKLAGGVYGVFLNGIFFGESMFSKQENGSKAALWQLCARAPELGIRMIDCQFHTDHLESLGAREVDRAQFLHLLSITQSTGLIGLP